MTRCLIVGMPLPDNFEDEIKRSFLDETAQLLSETEHCFLDLESNPEDISILENIFRLAHNVKGSARAVGFDQVADFAHQLENLLIKLKGRQILVTEATVTLLLRSNDYIIFMIESLRKDINARFDSIEIGEALAAHGHEGHPETLEEMKQNDPSRVWLESPVFRQKPSSPDERIRVSLKKLDHLLNNVGELVVMQTVLDQHKSQVQNSILEKTIGQLSKVTHEIQDISMSLRMVPLRQTFQKMQRIVRDTASVLGKEINFEVIGEDTEVDKTVLENFGDPLMHLLRNSVDHGIETPEIRKKNGKPKIGQVTLSASYRGNLIVVEIRDDGGGLNTDAILRRAQGQGLIQQERALTPVEINNLVFQPGFSTREEVTDISGRGVGLDVVKFNVEKLLHGKIELETVPGQGTCFRILLPLTIAIIDGMVVRVNGERYILPLTQVSETLRPARSDVHKVTGVGEVMKLRHEDLPAFRLENLLNRKNLKPKELWQSIAIIVRASEKPFAVVVDDIIGRQQVVVKRLGDEINNIRGFTGCAILGDGKAAIILDLVELTAKTAPASRTSRIPGKEAAGWS